MDTATNFSQVLLSLIVVLGALGGLAWLTNRIRSGGGLGQTNLIRILSSTSIGQKERLVLIEVAGEQLLLGVGSSGVNTLHRLTEPVSVEQATAPAGVGNLFSKLLAQHQGARS